MISTRVPSAVMLALALVMVTLDGLMVAEASPLAHPTKTREEDRDLVAASQLSIVGEPQNVELLSGASTTLNCEAFGTPVPTIQWMKDGKLVRLDAPAFNKKSISSMLSSASSSSPSSSPVMAERLSNHGIRTFQMSTTSSKLHIPCVGKDTIGQYTCVANNGRETVTANATVGLVEKSNSLWGGNDCQRKRGGELGSPAQIYMWTDSRMERPGVSVQLMCRASGSPAPRITWFQAEDPEASILRPIGAEDDSYTLLPNGDLLVKETPPQTPLSIFVCEAINKHGSDRVTAMLLEIIDDGNNADEAGPSNGEDGDNNEDEMSARRQSENNEDNTVPIDLPL